MAEDEPRMLEKKGDYCTVYVLYVLPLVGSNVERYCEVRHMANITDIKAGFFLLFLHGALYCIVFRMGNG